MTSSASGPSTCTRPSASTWPPSSLPPTAPAARHASAAREFLSFDLVNSAARPDPGGLGHPGASSAGCAPRTRPTSASRHPSAGCSPLSPLLERPTSTSPRRHPHGRLPRPSAATRPTTCLRAIEHHILDGTAQDVHRVVSPLAMAPVTPRDARAIFAGMGDRLATADQARRLWDHWQQPEMCWFPAATGYPGPTRRGACRRLRPAPAASPSRPDVPVRVRSRRTSDRTRSPLRRERVPRVSAAVAPRRRGQAARPASIPSRSDSRWGTSSGTRSGRGAAGCCRRAR